MVKEVEMKMKP